MIPGGGGVTRTRTHVAVTAQGNESFQSVSRECFWRPEPGRVCCPPFVSQLVFNKLQSCGQTVFLRLSERPGPERLNRSCAAIWT